MSVAEELLRLGGVATRAQLIRASSRAEVDAAVGAGDIVIRARNRYVSPEADEAVAAAHALTGHLAFESAAQHWGWAVKLVPRVPHVAVAKNRRVSADQQSAVALHRMDLGPDDVDGIATSRERTLVDCMRRLPFDAALAVVDSALRDGFPRERLLALARDARGPGAPQIRRVAGAADGRAANAFESILRAITREVPGLSVRPQVSIREPHFLGRPDLVDERLRIVLEADSFAWHGDRAALDRDTRRYNALVCRGWLVLRFSWEQVMFEPGLVEDTLRLAVYERTEVVCPTCRAA